MPYILQSIDNWDLPDERTVLDVGSFEAPEEVVSAAKGVIDASLRSLLANFADNGRPVTSDHLFQRWMSCGDNVYILCVHMPSIDPRFDPYRYAFDQAFIVCTT